MISTNACGREGRQRLYARRLLFFTLKTEHSGGRSIGYTGTIWIIIEPPNSMKSVQTYRKNSAEWMGFQIEFINGKRYYVKDKIKIRVQAWQPDIDYSQMHMMIDKLIGEKVLVRMNHVGFPPIWWVNVGGCFGNHNNIRTAFRLACTEFKTAKQQKRWKQYIITHPISSIYGIELKSFQVKN